MRPTSVITKSAPVLVGPSEATPSGTLPLSAMERNDFFRVFVDLLLVFNGGRGRGDPPAVETIKAAMAKSLVPYYPVAGRIAKSKAGELEVACTGEGITFVEAYASCRLEDVNDLERPLMLHKPDLLPLDPPHSEQEDLIFMMQVTQFECGGFTVGIRFNHRMFDGIGAGQFIKAVGDMARGLERPSVQPVWRREKIAPRPSEDDVGRHHQTPPLLIPFNLETCVSDVSLDRINAFKREFTRQTGKSCTIFEVITAILWKCRTRAINLKTPEDTVVQLVFVANTRHVLHEVLPKEGYYGNCLIPMSIEASGRAVADGSIVEIVKLVKDAKARLPGRFMGWMRGEAKEDPYVVPFDYGTMVVSDWNYVGFGEVDYGWGPPTVVDPLNDDNNYVASAFYLRRRPTGNGKGTKQQQQGVRLISRCVETQHLQAFRREMIKFA